MKTVLLTLSSSTDVCVNSSAQALVSKVTSDPDKEADTPSQAINTFIPSCREREVALGTHYVFVNSPNNQLHTLQKVSWLSNTQAVALVSNHWPPGPQVLDTKASLVSSGKASHGHWIRAVSMWSVCGQWKVMLSDLIACSTERQGRAERRERGEQHYGHHLSRLANHIQINNLLTLKSRIKQMIAYS